MNRMDPRENNVPKQGAPDKQDNNGEFAEFELLDKDVKSGNGHSFKQEFSHSFHKLEGKQFSVGIRIICLICAIFMMIALVFIVPVFLLFLGFNILTLFQMSDFWARTKVLWRQLIKVVVLIFGLLVSVISPSVGLALIVVYLAMSGQSRDQEWVSRIMKAGSGKP